MCDVSALYDLEMTTFSPDAPRRRDLDSWGTGDSRKTRIKINLELEHFLPPASLEQIFEVILEDVQALPTEDVTSFENNYQETCKNYLLQGGEITRKPKMVGTAINKPIFKGFLKKQAQERNIILDEQEAENFIKALLKTDDESLKRFLTEDKLELLVKRYNIWVTWDTNSDNPFSFRKTKSPNEVRLCLALGNSRGTRFAEEDLLLLVYNSKLKVFRPTIADAQIGGYFQPPPKDFEEHGLTYPCDQDLQKSLIPYLRKHHIFSCERRPEGLHKSITVAEVINEGRFEELNYDDGQ